MTWQRLKYGVVVAAGLALTGTLVWWDDYGYRPHVETVDFVHLVMATQERLAAIQVLSSFPSQKVYSVTNVYPQWIEYQDQKAVWYSYPIVTNYVTNVVPPHPPTVTAVVQEVMVSNFYLIPSGIYITNVQSVTSIWPASSWNDDSSYIVPDGRKALYSGFSNYVAHGFTNNGGGANGNYYYSTSVVSYYGAYDKYINSTNPNSVLRITWKSLLYGSAGLGADIYYFEDHSGTNDDKLHIWITTDTLYSRTHVSASQWSDFFTGGIEEYASVIGSNGVRYGQIRSVDLYTNKVIRNSIAVDAYIDDELLRDLSRQIRRLHYGDNSWLFGEIYEWFRTIYPTNYSEEHLVDGIYTNYMYIPGANPNGSFFLKSDADGYLENCENLYTAFRRGYDAWKEGDYGPVIFYAVPYGTNGFGEAYVWLRFRDETTNYTSYLANWWFDHIADPQLIKTNWSIRYDALQKLGNRTKRHVQQWTATNANQYVWTGNGASYADAIAACLASAPVTTTNAGAPYRYTTYNIKVSLDGETNHIATAHARMAVPYVTGISTSLTKQVEFYMQTIPCGAWRSSEGYSSNKYYRLPDYAYDAENAYSFTGHLCVGSVEAFSEDDFRTNNGAYGWQCGDVGPVITWDFQYCTDELP